MGDVFLLPYVTVEGLFKYRTKLIRLLHYRSTHAPEDWVVFDVLEAGVDAVGLIECTNDSERLQAVKIHRSSSSAYRVLGSSARIGSVESLSGSVVNTQYNQVLSSTLIRLSSSNVEYFDFYSPQNRKTRNYIQTTQVPQGTYLIYTHDRRSLSC